MRSHRFLVLGCLALAGLLAGCQSVQPLPDPRISVDPALSHDLAIGRLVTMRNQGNIMEVQATLINLGYRTLPLDIRVDWFDLTGIKQDSLTEKWRTISVSRRGEYSLKVTAPNDQATDFRCYINETKRN